MNTREFLLSKQEFEILFPYDFYTWLLRLDASRGDDKFWSTSALQLYRYQIQLNIVEQHRCYEITIKQVYPTVEIHAHLEAVQDKSTRLYGIAMVNPVARRIGYVIYTIALVGSLIIGAWHIALLVLVWIVFDYFSLWKEQKQLIEKLQTVVNQKRA